MPDDISIRAARDADAEALIRLIDGCFSEYPGCVMDLDNLDKDLLAIDSHIKALGGEFWVAERAGRVVGCIGYAPCGDRVVELKRLYVDKSARRGGLGGRLYDLVLAAARRHGARAINLWSDTRFKEAHAFYLRQGFRRLEETRDLHDPSNTTEYHFVLEL